MKKLFLTAFACITTLVAFGQGVVSINTAGANAYVKYSNTVDSVLCSGTLFNAGLYWASDSATLASGGGSLVVGLANFGTGTSSGYVLGTTGGGNRTIASQAGTLTYFQLRAWSTGFSDYASALAGPAGTLFSVISGPNAAPIVSATPTSTSGQSPTVIAWAPGSSSGAPLFVNLIAVPEPSVIALGVLGLGGLLFLRRRK